MKVGLKRGLIVLAAYSCLGLSFTFGQESAEAPVYNNGDFWRFRAREYDFLAKSSLALDGDYEVVYQNGKLAVSQLAGEEKTLVGAGQGVTFLRLLIGTRKMLEDERRLLHFPLFVGKKWSAQFLGGAIGERRQWQQTEYTVTGVEEIATPAGRFRAFKIEGYQSPLKSLYTYYYSPQTKSIVKYHLDTSGGGEGGKREIELIRFSLKN